MPRYESGDIVYCRNVPYRDKTGFKTRPVLIISNKYLDYVNEFIYIEITENKPIYGLGLYLRDEWLSHPMRLKSYLKFYGIGTLLKSHIDRKISELKPECFEKIKNKLEKILM